jgi:hypothetical protein
MAIAIEEPSLLIRIPKLFHAGMSAQDLYDATRGVWKLGYRREGAKLAFAVNAGVIREEYEIEKWHPAGSTAYATRKFEDSDIRGRWEFTGQVASPELREKYVGESVADYFKRGARAPVTYVNL